MATDNGLVNGVVLLDLRKAFDLVNHTVLEKLTILTVDAMVLFVPVRAPAVCTM